MYTLSFILLAFQLVYCCVLVVLLLYILINSKTVSYTHLDVYKRQTSHHAYGLTPVMQKCYWWKMTNISSVLPVPRT